MTKIPASWICSGALLTAAVGAQAGITSVVESNGDTDRPSAKQTGLTFNIENPTGTVLVQDYKVGTFGDDAKAMTDRLHDYNASSATVPLPTYLVGREYIMIANNDRDNADYKLEITLSQPALVYLLIDNRLGDGDAATPPTFTSLMKWVPDQLWIPFTANGNHVGNFAFPDDVGIDENADGSVNNWSSVYAKLFPAGTVNLNEFGEAGRNMYGVVVASIPEPSALSLFGVFGAGLWFASRRRRA